MSYQQKDNSGALFKNENKESDKHPDYSGSAVVDGVDYFMDAWLNVAESGRKYMSFRFKTKEKQSAAQPQRSAPKRTTAPGSARSYGSAGDDRDIPF